MVAALHRRGALSGTTVGLVPLGTGNDFARTLGLPLDAAEAAGVIATGQPRRIDLVVDDHEDVTVNSVHLGAGADAGAKGARWKERLGSVGVGKVNLGKLGYPIGAVQTALNPPTLRVRVEVDGEVVADLDEKVLMVAVGNGASVGGGTELTPDADPGDGQVDVLVATPVGTLSRLGYALRLPFGRHGEHADVPDRARGRGRGSAAPRSTATATGRSTGRCASAFVGRKCCLPAAYAMVVPTAADGDESEPEACGNSARAVEDSATKVETSRSPATG